jgi:hypothetical protein
MYLPVQKHVFTPPVGPELIIKRGENKSKTADKT